MLWNSNTASSGAQIDGFYFLVWQAWIFYFTCNILWLVSNSLTWNRFCFLVVTCRNEMSNQSSRHLGLTGTDVVVTTWLKRSQRNWKTPHNAVIFFMYMLIQHSHFFSCSFFYLYFFLFDLLRTSAYFELF